MYYFIINPKSRSGEGRKVWKIVKHELDRQNIIYDYYYTEYTFHAAKITESICTQKEGIKNIVVIGGDGTVNEVINGITNFDDIILGYIPSGSSNDLARSLKLPKDPIDLLNKILSPNHFKYIDTGFIKNEENNEIRSFTVSSGMGFDAAVCEETFRSKLKKCLNRIGLGKLTYIIIALKQLLTCRFIQGDVIIDGKTTRSYQKVLLITSMIHKYEGGGLKIAPNANPYDGNLSVCIVYGLSRIKILTVLPTLLFGKHVFLKGVDTFDCQTLELKLNKPYVAHVDGECPGYYQHLSVSCNHKNLRIIV